MIHYDIVVIGGGPAGLAAAIEAKKNGIDKVILIERDRELGGILQQCIHNGFGLHTFKEELTGPEYAERYIEVLHALGIEYKLDTMVLEVSPDKLVKAINSEDGLLKIQAKAVILAMGCRERTRGAIRVPGTRPAGVMTAGTAQRFVNMEGYMVGKRVVILGSGDIGLIMARRMTLEGAEVLAVAELMPFSGGLKRNIVQCLDDFNIPLYLKHTVTNIEGHDRVSAVTIAEVDEKYKPIQGTEKRFECDTLLLSVGLIPENELSKETGIDLDKITSGPVVSNTRETSIPGIFACGNVVQVHDLVDWVSEESQIAGKNAANYVKQLDASSHEVALISYRVKATNGIRYVVPQKIEISEITSDLDRQNKVELMMRVDNVYSDVVIQVKSGEQILDEFKRPHVAPGEMENIKVNVEKLLLAQNGEISVELLRKEA